ncbi:MAG TPA: ferrous iron transport protein A [Firmicutes bacterium]|nr:ferrous iron transport protein A [Bacillota bacterium]
MTLREARRDKPYTIRRVNGEDKQSLRLMDMGFTSGCKICVLAKAPGGAVLVSLRDFVVALRADVAALVEVVAQYV